MDDTKKVNIRFPEILHAKLSKEVQRFQQTIPQYSLNALVLEACRVYLDGPTHFGHSSPVNPVTPVRERTVVPDDDYAQHKLSAAEIAARIPGVRKGL